MFFFDFFESVPFVKMLIRQKLWYVNLNMLKMTRMWPIRQWHRHLR